MKRIDHSEKFNSYMIHLNQLIESNGKLNLLSGHVHAEYLYRDLLNLLFQYSLKNANDVIPNAPAIDLIDEQNKIIIQVSATCTKRKIESALSKDIIFHYVKDGYNMKFLFIGKQNGNIKGKDYLNPHEIQFDSAKDVLLTSDLNQKFISLNIDDQAEVVSLLRKEIDPGIHEETAFTITDEFVDYQLQSNITSLGPRYTPNLNVETDNMFAFEAITISDSFQKDNNKHLKDIIDSVQRVKESRFTSQKAKGYYHEFREEIEGKVEKVDSFLRNDTSFNRKINELKRLGNKLKQIQSISDRYSRSDIELEKEDKKTINDYFMDVHRNISLYNHFLDSTCHETLYNPYLLLHGEAGIGKSHLLADMANNKRKQGHIVFLFLGQHFSSNSDPWKQIMNGLDLAVSIEEFLSTVNREAKDSGRRAIFIIDALNEGEGRSLWKNYFQKFIAQIKQYSNICLIFSIRTPFIDLILPEGFIELNDISEFKHVGFANEDYSPIETFCTYYNLEVPVFPLLNPEYDNPLFLKLVCQLLTSKNQSSFSDDIKMSTLFSFIIEDANKKLADVDRLDYDSNLGVIQEILNEVVALQHKSLSREMKYSDVYGVIRKVAEEYTDHKTKVLGALIEESILSDSVNFLGEKIVYFAYERMGDYLLADYLLKSYEKKMIEREKSFKDIRQDEKFNKYFSNESDMSFNEGLMQALSVLMPEDIDIEFFEVYSDKKSNFNMQSAFVDSLIWRTGESITETTKEYINAYVFSREFIADQFLDVLIQKSCVFNHPLNAHALTKLLLQLRLPDRDAFWTTKISNNNNNVFKIINWSWENNRNVPLRTVELYEMILIWMVSSTNRHVRDSSTKALGSLFKQHPDTMVSMLHKFKEIDDPYILERLYAAVLGGVVRSENKDSHPAIAAYIYHEIFRQTEIYPHVLLRDYARQTIEFILLTFDLPEIDEENIQPPYKSVWYKHIPTNEEIDQLEVENTIRKNAHVSSAVNRIIDSMTTEYGRGTGGYGDFGRYVLGSIVRAWKNQFESDQELSNIAIQRVFDMGYDADLHGYYDLRVSPHDRHNNLIERIGKKYQWIAFHELMAKLTDNYPTYKEEKIYTTEYEQYQSLQSENLTRLINGEKQVEIETLDEAEHIEKVKKILTTQYNGPWEPFLRDIDPTFLIKDIPEKKLELIPNQMPINPTIEWVEKEGSNEDVRKYFEIEYENETYISLYALFSWQNKEENMKFSERDAKFFNASGKFVKNAKKVLDNKIEPTNGTVEIPSAYNIYAYEFFWSESYSDFEKERLGDEANEEILACHEYLWETDHSIENGEVAKYIIPGKQLVDYFNLKQTEEGFWQDKNGEILCFDTRLAGYDNCLLFKKDQLMNFLEEHNYSLMWKAYAEKVAKKHVRGSWYTIDYQDGEFEKHNIKEDIYEHMRMR